MPVDDVDIHEGGRASIGVVGEWEWEWWGSFISGMESGNGSERMSSCREGERAPTSGRAAGDSIEVDTFGESVPSYPSVSYELAVLVLDFVLDLENIFSANEAALLTAPALPFLGDFEGQCKLPLPLATLARSSSTAPGDPLPITILCPDLDPLRVLVRVSSKVLEPVKSGLYSGGVTTVTESSDDVDTL